MAKFPIERARERLGFVPATAVRARIDTDTGEGVAGAAIGQALLKVGAHFKKINDNRQVAEGIAEYNELINRHNESLANKNPSEYAASFETLRPQIEAITKNKSGTAREILNNKFAIWNESNRASTALLAVRAESALAKQEIPGRLQEFANKNQDTEASDYIDGFSNILSLRERELWKDTYGEIKNRNTIFRAINLAAENPTTKNLSTARKIIDKLSVDEIDKFNNMNRLRAKRGERTAIKNETFKALMNRQSDDMANTYSSGTAYEPQIVPELNLVKTQFDARLANGTITVGDGPDGTYKRISRQIDEGKFFSPAELVSSFATGMSKSEYEDVKKRNQDNIKLTIAQKESLTKFNSYINDRYQQMINTVRPKTSPATLPMVLAATDNDMMIIKKSVRGAVRDGLPDNEIYDKIEASFIADTDRIYKGWWSRKFSLGFFTDIGDFEPEILEIGDRRERYEVITDIMKSGEKFDLQRIDDLLEKWYE